MNGLEFCPTHRVRMLPTGCPLCRKAIERERQGEVEKVKKQGAKALVALAAVAGVWLFFTRDKTPVDPRLDPEAYHETIASMEKALYATGRLDAGARSSLGLAAHNFEGALRQAGRFSPKVKDDLVFFVARLGISPEIDGERFDWGAYRGEWETFRAANFRPADWFAHSSPALDEAQGTGEARGVVPDAAAYERTLEEIDHLLLRIASDVDALPTDYSGGVDPGALERWDDAERRAKEDVARIRAGLPALPRGAHSSWIKAWNGLDRNLKDVPALFRTVPNEYGRPDRYTGQSRVGQARARLAQTQKAIAEAVR